MPLHITDKNNCLEIINNLSTTKMC